MAIKCSLTKFGSEELVNAVSGTQRILVHPTEVI